MSVYVSGFSWRETLSPLGRVFLNTPDESSKWLLPCGQPTLSDSAPLTGASLRVGSSGRATAQRRARPQQFEWNTGAGAERLRGTERTWAGKSNGVPVTVCRTARVSSGSLPSDQWMRRTHRVDHTPL